MKVSKCCGAELYDRAENKYGQGYSGVEICMCCEELAEPIEQDEPSINVIEMPEMTDELREKMRFIKEDK